MGKREKTPKPEKSSRKERVGKFKEAVRVHLAYEGPWQEQADRGVRAPEDDADESGAK